MFDVCIYLQQQIKTTQKSLIQCLTKPLKLGAKQSPRLAMDLIFSSTEPKAHGELIVHQSSRRLCVYLCVSLSTLLNINISETSGPIATKFYMKDHWGGGKAALGFEQDRIGTLMSMATNSSHWVIMGKILLAL